MKKFLALTLALLMLVPMCIIGVSAKEVKADWTFGDNYEDLIRTDATSIVILNITSGNGVLDCKLQDAEFLSNYNKWVALAPTKPADKNNFSVSVNVSALNDGDNWVMNGASGRTRIFDLYDNYVNNKNYSCVRYRMAYNTQAPTLQYFKVVDGKEVAVYKLDGVATNVKNLDLSVGTEHNFTISVVDGKTYFYIDGIEIDDAVFEKSADNVVPSTTKMCDLERIATAGSCGIKLEHASATLNGWTISSEMLPVISGTVKTGETLKATFPGKTGGTWTWLQDGETVLGEGETYTLTAADEAHKISVKYTDAESNTYMSNALYLAGEGGITEGVTPPEDNTPPENNPPENTPPVNNTDDKKDDKTEETTAEETTAAPEETTAAPETEATDDGGCGSVIGGGALAVMAVVGCAVAFKKKSDD